MKDLTAWHLLAQLHAREELDMSEITKTMLINIAVGFLIETDGDKRVKVGYNALDKSDLYDRLVLVLVESQPKDKPITYAEMGAILKRHPQSISGSISRLRSNGVIDKEEFGTRGAFYTVFEQSKPPIPQWIENLARAMSDLHNDPELKAQAEKETERIGFKRGFQVLREELREKFYRPRKPRADKPD